MARFSTPAPASGHPPSGVSETRYVSVYWTWAASVAFHAALVGGVGWFAYYHLHANPPPVETPATMNGASSVAMELPGFAEGLLIVEREPDPTGDPPHPTGGAESARVDTHTTGHGGDRTVDMPATHLADRDEQMRLSPDLISRLDRDQQQRLRSANHRVAWEDRRATTNPMELTFLASGEGTRAERRVPSPFDPSRGAMASASPTVNGGAPGAAEHEEGELDEQHRVGSVLLGSTGSAPGVGVHNGKPGLEHLRTAAVMRARPDVAPGPVTVPASTKGRPNDDVDSEQEVASTVRALVHASTSGGAAGDGRGGIAAAGDPGAGGATGTGSHPRPLGQGDGDVFDLDTSDPRLVPYFRLIHKKVDPLWANAFPKSAILDLKQGTVILDFTIAADGSVRVSWPPARPSGIDEFDRNCADALRRASPFAPIPPELNRTILHVRAPFHASNPVVK